MGWNEWNVIGTWIAAIGTVGAVITALYFSQEANRASKAQAMQRARLAASRVVESLQKTEEELRNWTIGAFFESYDNSESENNQMKFQSLFECLQICTPTVSLQILSDLAPLSEQSAHRVARAVDIIEHVKRQMELFIVPNAKLTTRQRDSRLPKWHGSLRDASNLLNVALPVFQKAAQTAAPDPSGEELYGEES